LFELPNRLAAQRRLAFIDYLARQGRPAGTRLKYDHVLEQFTVWLDDRSPEQLSREELDCYLQSWREEFQRRRGRKPSDASYRSQVCALCSFYSWLERFDLLRDEQGTPLRNPMSPITAPVAKQRANDWLRPAEDSALLEVDCNPQERIIIWLLRWTGLRVGEATRLTIGDLDLTWGEEFLFVRESKTPAGRRAIVLVPELLPHVESWLRHLGRRSELRPDTPLPLH
jgi:integrase